MKKIIILTMLLSFGFVQAQKIKLKDNSVYVDNVETLKYNIDANTIEYSTLDNSQTILLKYIRTGVGFNGGLYYKIIFVEQDKSLTNRSYNFTKKSTVKKLIENGILIDGRIDESKIGKFILKFDDKIEETLIRN